jgi:2,3-diaminopropionate biosynthesis protein SbnA
MSSNHDLPLNSTTLRPEVLLPSLLEGRELLNKRPPVTRPVPQRELVVGMASLARAMRPTPVVALEQDGVRLLAKLEFQNPVGSLKDRPALWILKSAIERGEINADTTIIESSSGNFAVAVAAYCQMLGLKFIPVIDPNISKLNEATLRASCARVVQVDKPDEVGGYLKTRLDMVQRLLKEIPNSFWTNQYGNADGMHAHYHLTAGEICNQVAELDYVFVGVSSAGTISGVSRRIKQKFPKAKIVAVDAVGSVIFGGPSRKRYIPGIGASIQPQLLSHAQIDEVVHVPEIETVAGCRELLNRHGLFVGGSSGTVYAAIKNYLPQLKRKGTPPSVLFLCADRGFPYAATVYNPSWVARLEASSGV